VPLDDSGIALDGLSHKPFDSSDDPKLGQSIASELGLDTPVRNPQELLPLTEKL
jgi:hypothetical protein